MLTPDILFDSYRDITPAFLQSQGVTLLLTDLDYTLAPKAVRRPDDALRQWIDGLKDAGITVMSDLKMGPVETRFAEIIWEKEPVGSTELVKLAEEALGWKKSTTYTVLKRLCDRGIFQNEGGTVTSRLSRADYDTAQSQQFVEESFSGSLPAFITAFTRRKKLTEDEIAELQKLIDQNRR